MVNIYESSTTIIKNFCILVGISLKTILTIRDKTLFSLKAIGTQNSSGESLRMPDPKRRVSAYSHSMVPGGLEVTS